MTFRVGRWGMFLAKFLWKICEEEEEGGVYASDQVMLITDCLLVCLFVCAFRDSVVQWV